MPSSSRERDCGLDGSIDELAGCQGRNSQLADDRRLRVNHSQLTALQSVDPLGREPAVRNLRTSFGRQRYAIERVRIPVARFQYPGKGRTFIETRTPVGSIYGENQLCQP